MIKPLPIILLSLTFLCNILCTAQPFKLIKATKQNWAGGVVGRTGVNYTIELEARLKTICPDTIWINGYVYPLDSSGKNNNFKSTSDSISHKAIYTISVGEEHDRFKRFADTTKVVNQKPRHFEGAALISYREKHKQRFYIVRAFTTLRQLNYP